METSVLLSLHFVEEYWENWPFDAILRNIKLFQKLSRQTPETPFVLHKINVTAENSTRKDKFKKKKKKNHDLAGERLKS